MGTSPLDSYHNTKFSQPQNFDLVDLDAREGETLPSATSAITYPTCQTACTGQIFHKEEEAEKSRIRMARYRASIKADPECVQEQKDRQKYADKAYREKNRNLLAFKKREKRKEANAQKGTKQSYQTEEKRDYALEYALWTHRKQDEL
ncbi:hypothetical protein K438DRAFT_2063389 [Mycena galopus ATCC 62051]|nr:hypothetical protein K438DRAFT_2063389 [Mycena galopus ATCC 62051]